MIESDTRAAYDRGERWLKRLFWALMVGAAMMGACTTVMPVTRITQPLILREYYVLQPEPREWEVPCCLDEDLPETERKT